MIDAGFQFSPGPKRSLIPEARIAGLVLVVTVILVLPAFRPDGGGLRHDWNRASVATTAEIGKAMHAYALDSQGKYPAGNSSTEVFQKLLDGGYITDPTLFYIPLSGKTPFMGGSKLKPENVCFDITAGVDSGAPAGLPLVFLTGYRVTYAPGGGAVPIIKPYPPYEGRRTWFQWWCRAPATGPSPGIAVTYNGGSTTFLDLPPITVTAVWTDFPPKYKSDASIPQFVTANFNPQGKTYRQLTPDGLLP